MLGVGRRTAVAADEQMPSGGEGVADQHYRPPQFRLHARHAVYGRAVRGDGGD